MDHETIDECLETGLEVNGSEISAELEIYCYQVADDLW